MSNLGDIALQETLTTLELALDSEGWLRIGGGSEREFSRGALTTINQLARYYYLKSPLIRRGVAVQADYVFGQSVEISAETDEVNAVVQEFLDDRRNKTELFGHQAMLLKETELTLFGNLFFVFFTNSQTGRVVIRTLPMDEIEDIITDPEDAKQPWFYRRVWTQTGMDAQGMAMSETKRALYPDYCYRPSSRPASWGDTPIMWGSPVYHVKVGALPDMRFGVSEVYAALDWAKAYTKFLEDWATITRAYSRFAWQLKVPGGSTQIAAAKARLNTTVTDTASETNPPPITGSTFISGAGTDMQPIRTAGATVSMEDGRRLLLMVCATVGLPESFFGDVSVGTLATAKSLDRPTELKMRNRQSLWEDVFTDIFWYVLEQAVRARRLAGTVIDDEDGVPVLDLGQTDDGQGNMVDIDATVHVTFPPILEHDVAASVQAITQAATLGGAGTLAGTIDQETVSRMLLTALGERDIDATLGAMYPKAPETAMPTGEQPIVVEPVPEQVTEALRDLRDTIRDVVTKWQG